MKTREPVGRHPSQIRPLSFVLDFSRYAEGSVLVKAGHTHVLCTATIEESIPSWLKGKGEGWVTAEYSMLPRSTHTRTRRDREKVSGRTQEIQRLIGRALRTMVDTKLLGERQVIVDCDVLQADGGTRTASITGGCVALGLALDKLIKAGKCKLGVWVDTVAAISVGMHDAQVLVDLDYNEDSSCEVDMNFVMTGKGGLVEVQGTAERKPFSVESMNSMLENATAALRSIRTHQLDAFAQKGVTAP